MFSPEGPTGGAIRQAILDDEADGGVDDASGVAYLLQLRLGF
jgi:hypothetical protein